MKGKVILVTKERPSALGAFVVKIEGDSDKRILRKVKLACWKHGLISVIPFKTKGHGGNTMPLSIDSEGAEGNPILVSNLTAEDLAHGGLKMASWFNRFRDPYARGFIIEAKEAEVENIEDRETLEEMKYVVKYSDTTYLSDAERRAVIKSINSG
jgi:hypothetical protein